MSRSRVGSEDEQRRLEVEELLRGCTDEKLRRGGTQQAKELANRAYTLAMADPVLPEPRPQLAAYRLAHLILREGPHGGELLRVDELLSFAGTGSAGRGAGLLGPMPRLYGLAVLHRLMLEPTGAGSGPTAARLNGAVSRARESVKQHLASWKTSQEGWAPDPLRAPIQDHLFNMLELATDFLGAPYGPLEGEGGPFRDLLLGQDAWQIVGPDPGIATVRMPRELAFAELDDRGRRHPGAVLFRLCRERAQWRAAEQGDWMSANEDEARLLAYVLRDPGISSTELRRRVVGDSGEDPSDRSRQVKRRLNKDVRNLTRRSIYVVPEPDPRTRENRIHPDIRVFGAVEVDALSRRGRSSRLRP